MSAKDMLTFYEVNSSNIHILDEPDATEYIDEGPMIPVFNPMYSDFEK